MAYAEKLQALQKETEWLIVCDLDEFIYSRKGFETISSYLRSLPLRSLVYKYLGKFLARLVISNNLR